MSSERYNIRTIDSETEWFESGISSKVAPFPVRKWKEPLPIAVEGRPISNFGDKTSETGKDITRFYPPLLILSVLLTAVFFVLYVTKPVVIEKVVADDSGTGSANENSTVIVPAPVDELIPWPGDETLNSASSRESSFLAGETFFPERLPSVSGNGSSEREGGEGILISFFDAVSSESLSGPDEEKANLIQKELAVTRMEAEALQLQARDLEQQWNSLVGSTSADSSTVNNER
jgi:hypothetical protein